MSALVHVRSNGNLHLHDDVEVHAVDTDRRVVLDAQVDVLGDTETEVAGGGEVALAELVLLDLEATLDDLLGLGATDGDVDGDLLVTADTEGTDGVAGLACGSVNPTSSSCNLEETRLVLLVCSRTVDGSLTAQLLEHLGGTSKSVTRLTNRDVQDELGDAELAHGVAGLVLAGIVAGELVSLLLGVLSACLHRMC